MASILLRCRMQISLYTVLLLFPVFLSPLLFSFLLFLFLSLSPPLLPFLLWLGAWQVLKLSHRVQTNPGRQKYNILTHFSSKFSHLAKFQLNNNAASIL